MSEIPPPGPAVGTADRPSNRMVLLAYHYPPQVGVASDRAASLARWLPEFGWGVDVVTVADPAFPSVSGDDEPIEGRVVRTRAFEVSRWARSAVAGGKAARGSEALDLRGSAHTLRGFVRQALYVPDSRVGWIPWARNATRRLLSEMPHPGVVYSTSVPYSAHLAAWLSLLPDTMWIAEFRDPWSEAHPFLRPRSASRRALDDRIHNMILQRADRVVVTSESTADRLVAKTGLDPSKIAVIRNGFEPASVSSGGAPGEGCDVLYAGSVAPGETVRPLLEGLARARSKVGSGLTLTVLGPEEPWRSALSELGGIDEAVSFQGTVSPAGARASMRASAANLLLNWHPAYHAILPGKAFEYLGAARPILAGVQPDTELATLLRTHGEVEFVGAHEAEAWATAFAALWVRRSATDANVPPLPPAEHDLTRRAQASRLACVLDETVRA